MVDAWVPSERGRGHGEEGCAIDGGANQGCGCRTAASGWAGALFGDQGRRRGQIPLRAVPLSGGGRQAPGIYGIGVLDTGIAASRGGLSLAEARDRAAALHRTVRAGNDPVADRRQEKLARIAAALATQEVPTLADALKRYIEKELPAWTSARYTLGWARAVEDHAGKLLKLRVDTITHQMVAKALERSWVAAPVTARKVRSRVEAILTYATAQGWEEWQQSGCAGDDPGPHA